MLFGFRSLHAHWGCLHGSTCHAGVYQSSCFCCIGMPLEMPWDSPSARLVLKAGSDCLCEAKLSVCRKLATLQLDFHSFPSKTSWRQIKKLQVDVASQSLAHCPESASLTVCHFSLAPSFLQVPRHENASRLSPGAAPLSRMVPLNLACPFSSYLMQTQVWWRADSWSSSTFPGSCHQTLMLEVQDGLSLIMYPVSEL